MLGTPFTVAEEALADSSSMRGLGQMERTAAPKGPNMFDAGAASKVGVNTQPYKTQRLQQQNILQNTGSAASQANAGAVQQARNMQLVQDNAEYKANAFAEERKSEVMSVLGSPATLAMGTMSGPDQAAFRQDIATGKAMSMGLNPDLAQNQVDARRYM